MWKQLINFFITKPWITFILIFALFAKSLWFYYYFGLYAFSRKEYNTKFTGKTALIVPCFNEDLEKLDDTIKHALDCEGIDEYVFIDDGSKNDVASIFQKYHHPFYFANTPNKKLTFVQSPKNVGKRNAQALGFKQVSNDVKIFICMDSDTILQKNSITELLKPFNDKEIGGTTACILVRNEKKNLLTRAITSMYWSASKIWRQAPSSYDFVQVTNGQLSAYRKELIDDMLPNYLNQKFMGVTCTLSDDRYITHHIQTDYAKKVVYVDTAEVYTYIPETYIGAYKMFLRWKRGSWRESVLVLSRTMKKPLLVADVWANHTIQIMQTIVRIAIVIIAITYSPMVILHYFGVVIFLSLLFGYHMIWEKPSLLPYRIIYSLMNEIFFGWTHVVALFTIHKQGSWSTR